MKPAETATPPPTLGLTLSVLLAVVVLTDPAGGFATLPTPACQGTTEARESFAAQLVQQLHRWQGGQTAITPPAGRLVAQLAPVPTACGPRDGRSTPLPDSPLQPHLLNLPPPTA